MIAQMIFAGTLTIAGCAPVAYEPAERIMPTTNDRPSCDLPILVDFDFVDFDSIPCDLDGTARLDIRYGDTVPESGYHGDCYDMGGLPFSDSQNGTNYCLGVDY